uniref:Uncharacterized protein n=1 Tax=Anguilla anguilla TaxID=7936 RepID=A0A0E9W9L8_ANGAN
MGLLSSVSLTPCFSLTPSSSSVSYSLPFLW